MQPTKKDQKRLEYIITVRYYSGIMYDLHWFMESYPRLNVHIENIDMENQWFPQKKNLQTVHSPHLYVSLWDIYDTTIPTRGFPICHMSWYNNGYFWVSDNHDNDDQPMEFGGYPIFRQSHRAGVNWIEILPEKSEKWNKSLPKSDPSRTSSEGESIGM